MAWQRASLLVHRPLRRSHRPLRRNWWHVDSHHPLLPHLRSSRHRESHPHHGRHREVDNKRVETDCSTKQTIPMTFIGLFLKSIFIMVLMVAIFLIGIVSFIYLRVKRMTKQFRNGTNHTNRRQQQNSAAGSTKRRSAEYDDGVVVEEELYDERSPRQANRKIFAKDEGEYVDFEEEK